MIFFLFKSKFIEICYIIKKKKKVTYPAVTIGLPEAENANSPALACLKIAIGVFGCTLGVIIPILSALAALGLILTRGVRYFDRELLVLSALALSKFLFDGANGVFALLELIHALGPPGVKFVGALMVLEDAPVEALRRTLVFFSDSN